MKNWLICLVFKGFMHQSGFAVLSSVTFLMDHLKQVSRQNSTLNRTHLPSSFSLAQLVCLHLSPVPPGSRRETPDIADTPDITAPPLLEHLSLQTMVLSLSLETRVTLMSANPDKLPISYCFLITLLIFRFSVPHFLHRTLVRRF